MSNLKVNVIAAQSSSNFMEIFSAKDSLSGADNNLKRGPNHQLLRLRSH